MILQKKSLVNLRVLRGCTFLILGWMLLGYALMASAEQRFPPPDFESGHVLPPQTFQEVRPGVRPYIDFGVFVVALILAAWFLHAKRSRRAIFILGLLCLLYFGFYKLGCVCPIGAIQNLSLGFVDRGFPVALPIVGFFFLPLVLAMLFGRVLCGSVCPLGVIQDLFIFKPLRVPRWLEESLGLLRFFYLGAAIFLAVSLRRFVICEYDPFVGMFRMNGSLVKIILGAGFLLLGLVIARPYCRYLCPYGALLSLLGRWTTYNLSITPDDCIKCGLCEDVCPFGAIRTPQEPSIASRRTQLASLLVSLSVAACLSIGGCLAFRKSVGGLLLGLWFGLVIGARLMGLLYSTRQIDFEPDPGACLSCGRCYKWCPRERERVRQSLTTEV